ncbi:aspartyl/asparaginyl beta-hydroxylase domain-containing protein [Reichenbachiella sp. MALMAid0571]|uniref:aspartyl/asparaginyl beta-hydroxylase domain-containing protein n=1 Tax=Reichenbachiella sp. MALMAid0571 TaxID=3143939 RepID=UPI0032DEF2A6
MTNRGIVYRVNSLFRKLEKIGVIRKTPNFVTDCYKDYPELKILEDNYPLIRKECENILTFKENITDVKNLMGNQTQGGIHTIKWKSFMLKSGVFVKENCEVCPETTKILTQVPGIRTAFFSILDPEQYITPHEGYYDGFMRYHLGVIIPNNNANQECWIRIANEKIDKTKISELGNKYYWKNGEGVLFNDNYTHDAHNQSKEIRVILWLDVERKLPLLLSLINKIMLNVAYSTEGVKKVAKNAVVKF